MIELVAKKCQRYGKGLLVPGVCLVAWCIVSIAAVAATEPLPKKKGFEFVPAPLISYNRSIGFMVGMAPMAMYPLRESDTVSPRSISAVAGFYSTSGTWMGATFHKLYFNEDRWRVLAGAGVASVNFQTYVSGSFNDMLGYNTGAYFAIAEVQRQIIPHVYAGVRFMLSQASTVFDSLAPEPVVEDFRTLGLVAALDFRDAQYYPRSGSNTELRVDLIPTWLGNSRSGTKIIGATNIYIPQRDSQDVIALRAMIGSGIGADLPFSYEFIVGKGRDIRGYTQGVYRGNTMAATQGEYRMHIAGKWGAVGFAGIATVYGSQTPSQDGTLLPCIGAGIRYLIFEQNTMNIGLDGAIGRGDWGVYFQIGEAF